MRVRKLGGLSSEDEIGRQRHFQRAGVAMAMDGGDDGLWQLFHQAEGFRMPAARRDSFAFSDVAEVMARREAFACAFQDDAADALILVEVADMAPQFAKHADRERVQLVRPIERQPAKAIVILARYQICHRCLLLAFYLQGRLGGLAGSGNADARSGRLL